MGKKNKSRGNLKLNVITSCISTMLVLVLIGIVVFFVSVAANFSIHLRENFTVTLMLDDDISNTEAYNLQTRLRAMPCASHVRYVSKEKAQKTQREALGCDPAEFNGTNPMPASFEMRLKADYANSDSLAKFMPALKAEHYIIDVDYPDKLMDSINENIRNVSTVLLVVAVLLMFVSFVLINNTMRLSVYSRRFEIRTMQLVGARSSFIRRPFMKRAFWVGFIAATLACALLGFGIKALLEFDPSLQSDVDWYVWVATLGSVMGCGIILILVCSYFSVNKYLRMRAGDLYRC